MEKEKGSALSFMKKLLDPKFGEKRKIQLLVVLGAVGMLLIIFPTLFGDQPQAEIDEQPTMEQEPEEDYAVYLSKQLENILCRIEGVGKIKVMVTLSRQEEYIYATDLSQDSQNIEETAQNRTDEKHVVIEKDGQEEPLITTRIAPKVQGVIVVCEGGNDPVVVNKLTEAVTASLGIGANHIAVSNSTYAE